MEVGPETRRSENVTAVCLGHEASIKDPQFGAVMQCMEDVSNLRNASTASTIKYDVGVDHIRDGVLHSLAIDDVNSVEKFLKNPQWDNVPYTDTIKMPGYATLENVMGHSTSLEHKIDLVNKTDRFLKSKAGDDLVLKIDSMQGGPS